MTFINKTCWADVSVEFACLMETLGPSERLCKIDEVIIMSPVSWSLVSSAYFGFTFQSDGGFNLPHEFWIAEMTACHAKKSFGVTVCELRVHCTRYYVLLMNYAGR